MPKSLALVITLAFVAYLLRQDKRLDSQGSAGGSWLPFLWVLVECSRGISQWFEVFGIPVPGGTYEEGNPTDRVYYILIIGLGLNVLRQRDIEIGRLFRENAWIVVFLVYCLVAIVWSDYPFVAAKRWIKVLGNPIIVLIILTDPDPRQSFIRLFKRSAYVLIPISILFIKYFPEWGRGFSPWTGEAYNTGITTNKNMLGMDCLIFGFFLFWYFFQVIRWPRGAARRRELILCLAFLGMNWWLLARADSKTPLVALVLGCLVIIGCALPWCGGVRAGAFLLVGTAGWFVVDWMFGVYASVLRLLGRDATLTDRTLLWEGLLEVPINPLLGAGFESFWLGARREAIWEVFAFHPNQAHNGYLETYLNLGLIGLGLLVVLLGASYLKACRLLVVDFEWGRFCLGFLVAMLVYNWTEAGFKLISPIMLMLFLVSLRVPARSDRVELAEEEPGPSLLHDRGHLPGRS